MRHWNEWIVVRWDFIPLELFQNKHISLTYEGFFFFKYKPKFYLACSMCTDTIQIYLGHSYHHESPPPSVKAPESLGQETTIIWQQQTQNCLQSRFPQKPNQQVPGQERKLIECPLGFLHKCDQDHPKQNECALGCFRGSAQARMLRWPDGWELIEGNNP